MGQCGHGDDLEGSSVTLESSVAKVWPPYAETRDYGLVTLTSRLPLSRSVEGVQVVKALKWPCACLILFVPMLNTYS